MLGKPQRNVVSSEGKQKTNLGYVRYTMHTQLWLGPNQNKLSCRLWVRIPPGAL